MQPDQFQQYYKALNKEQRSAVDTIEGPVMVIAGPGTGKTQILTLRIANILAKTDMEPEAILALTFTESGVASMRKRLAEIIGSPAYRVTITTFHGFANSIIQQYPEHFPRIIGATNITDIDQIKIMESVIDKAGIKELRPFGDRFYYLRAALGAIKNLKREGVNHGHFSLIIDQEEQALSDEEKLTKAQRLQRERQILKLKELLVIYRDYQAALRKQKLYDYDDMIVELLEALRESEELRLTLQERYQYFLVDEHQDTNNAQNKILELLASFHENPNVFIVGDQKQAIFRFQGASLENFLYFQRLYPKARLINLKDNYRSTQSILDAAGAELTARAGYQKKPIQLLDFSTSDAEQYGIARQIETLLKQKTKPEEIAILYRDNKDAFPIAHMLEKLGIPHSIESDQNILDDPAIKKLLLILEAVDDFGDDEKLAHMLHIDFLGLEPLEIYKLIGDASRQRIPLYDLLRKRSRNLYGKIASWKTLSKNQGPAALFEAVVRESGLLAHVLGQADYYDVMQKINTLFDQLQELIERRHDTTLSDFLAHLALLSEHGILIRNPSRIATPGHVRLMTVHRAKGLEFEYVFVAGLSDGHWGNRRMRELIRLPDELHTANDDDRNLFYVALTRARKEIFLSHAKQGVNGREQLQSQFVSEIKPELIERGAVSQFEVDFAKHRDILFAPAIPHGANIRDKKFLRELFASRGFAVTHLNNYLACPWKYFYVNLLRVPKAPEKSQMYGTAVHGTLKDYFTAYAAGKTVSKKYLLDRFAWHLERLPLSKSEEAESLAKGRISLGGYYDTYHRLWHKNVLSEFAITGIDLTPDVRLTGTIDKIEILDADNHATVTDYKTGKPKTRGFIEGTTKDSNGDYKRQLVFYNLLLNRFANGKYKMTSGEIGFVEPDEKGRYKKEKYIIDPREVKELEGLIKEKTSEILALKFWDGGCGKKDCEWCSLRKVMN